MLSGKRLSGNILKQDHKFHTTFSQKGRRKAFLLLVEDHFERLLVAFREFQFTHPAASPPASQNKRVSFVWQSKEVQQNTSLFCVTSVTCRIGKCGGECCAIETAALCFFPGGSMGESSFRTALFEFVPTRGNYNRINISGKGLRHYNTNDKTKHDLTGTAGDQ